MNAIQLAINFNASAPPGLINPLFIENYDWVDNRLRELYYDYDLSDELYISPTDTDNNSPFPTLQPISNYTEETYVPSTISPKQEPEMIPELPEPTNNLVLFPTQFDIENQYDEMIQHQINYNYNNYSDNEYDNYQEVPFLEEENWADEDWEDYDEGYDSY